MKRHFLLLLLIPMLLLSACGKTNGDSSSSGSSVDSGSSSTSDSGSSSTDSGDSDGSTHVDAPADAAMYRGTISSVEKDGDDTLFVIKQAEGTDFGNAAITVRFTADTNYKFKLEDATKGKYLEVYYGDGDETDATAGATPEWVDAIAANLYHSADFVLFNGTVKSITKADDNSGSISIVALDDNQEIIYHYSADTQFYLDLDTLKEGDKVNVFSNGMLAESFPPQGTILELRPYAEPSAE